MGNPAPGVLQTEPNGDILRALAIALFSGINPDGSAFTLTTAGGGGAVDVSDRVGRLLGHETNLDKRLANMTGNSTTVSAQGDTTIRTPASGKAIRVKWVGFSSPDSNGASTVVTVKLGATTLYTWDMSKNGGAFAHGTVREGAANDTLVVNLSVAATVHFNVELEEF